MLKRALIPAAVALAVSACAVGPDYSRPKVELPAAQAATQTPAVSADWWKQFDDPVLNQLIDEAVAGNADLQLAAARAEQAAAQAGIARAALLPALNANAGYQSGRSSSQLVTPGSPLVNDVRAANLTAAWELDLWGKLRRGNEAARAGYAASRYDRDAAQLALSAQVAQTYFQLRALDAQLDIAQRTLHSREESLKLQTKRFHGGLISELEQRQAEAEA
ncbi:TolC family protein, partial [Chromobacterium alticapitis]